MESSNGPLALSAPTPTPTHIPVTAEDTLPDNQDIPGQTLADMTVNADWSHTPAKPPKDPNSGTWLDTPAHVTDHGVPSNIRDSNSLQASVGFLKHNHSLDSASPWAADDVFQDNTLSYEATEGTDQAKKEQVQQGDALEEPSTPSNAAPAMGDTFAAAVDQVGEGEDTGFDEGYFKLQFPDSFSIVKALNLVIGRDESYLRAWQVQQKERKRRAKAQQALDEYALEPSQPSQPGDDDHRDPSSRSGEGDSLEGRPARGLLSNYSEQGGPVAYAPPSDDEELDLTRLRRRSKKTKVDSSSANSIAPQDLHLDPGEYVQTQDIIGEDGVRADPQEWAMLPVHPTNPDDIKKISREHVIFKYDSTVERWTLKVAGNGAFVNETHYTKGTEGIPLNDGDEIFISTLWMKFLLPKFEPLASDDEGDEDVLDSVEPASAISTSPVRRLSNLMDIDSDEEEEEEEPLAVQRARKPIKLKLSVGNKKKQSQKEPAKSKAQGKEKISKVNNKTKAKDESSGESPETAKKTERGQKPKVAAPSAAEPALSQKAGDENTSGPATDGKSEAKPDQASPPAVAVNLDPGSVLADLAPEQMPEKRKGPGRPPKNGLLSKRDESGIKRKQKEYQRRGLDVPDINTLLAIVRAEQRAKDLAAKAQARGDPIPDTPVPSIETDIKQEGDRGSFAAQRESHAEGSGSPMPGDGRDLSPRLPRRVRSPSPIKPMEQFTEEELKKPSMTYIYIIDEILQNIEGGQADLQTIYDKIQKRWPYYKYKVNSIGWQSSVRHNLLSCERFKDAGKSGKGKFWTINHDHPLDNKKKRPTPPPRPPPMPMQNGQMPPHGMHMPPNQYGQYPQPYGQQPGSGPPQYQHGQSGYYGPYNGPHPPGQMPPNRQGSNGAQARGTNPPQNGPASRPPSQQPVQQTPFQPVVDAIMSFRQRWLEPVVQDKDEYKRREELFKRSTDHFSNMFHGQGVTSIGEEELKAEPYASLKAIFERYQHLFKQQSSTSSATAGGAQPTNGSVNSGSQGSTATASSAQEANAGSSIAAASATTQGQGQPQVSGQVDRQVVNNGPVVSSSDLGANQAEIAGAQAHGQMGTSAAGVPSGHVPAAANNAIAGCPSDAQPAGNVQSRGAHGSTPASAVSTATMHSSTVAKVPNTAAVGSQSSVMAPSAVQQAPSVAQSTSMPVGIKGESVQTEARPVTGVSQSGATGSVFTASALSTSTNGHPVAGNSFPARPEQPTTPKAPSVEPLSRPASATGTKRAAGDDPVEADQDTKRPRIG